MDFPKTQAFAMIGNFGLLHEGIPDPTAPIVDVVSYGHGHSFYFPSTYGIGGGSVEFIPVNGKR